MTSEEDDSSQDILSNDDLSDDDLSAVSPKKIQGEGERWPSEQSHCTSAPLPQQSTRDDCNSRSAKERYSEE